MNYVTVGYLQTELRLLAESFLLDIALFFRFPVRLVSLWSVAGVSSADKNTFMKMSKAIINFL